jgi:hypothetical protein
MQAIANYGSSSESETETARPAKKKIVVEKVEAVDYHRTIKTGRATSLIGALPKPKNSTAGPKTGNLIDIKVPLNRKSAGTKQDDQASTRMPLETENFDFFTLPGQEEEEKIEQVLGPVVGPSGHPKNKSSSVTDHISVQSILSAPKDSAKDIEKQELVVYTNIDSTIRTE